MKSQFADQFSKKLANKSMAQLDAGAVHTSAAARKSQAKLRLGLPELRRAGVGFDNPTQTAGECRRANPGSKPSHDLTTAKVIDLIEKRLKWIHRTDLHVGKIHWHENNYYAIELIEADFRPVYFVYVDAAEGRFYWTEAEER